MGICEYSALTAAGVTLEHGRRFLSLQVGKKLYGIVNPRIMDMHSTVSVSTARQVRWTWICSLSSSLAALALALLAGHGWVLGDSGSISKNSGPPVFAAHLMVMGIVMIFATWIAGPTWIMLILSRKFRPTPSILILQLLVFGAGWLLVFGAMILIEVSPARYAF